MKLFCLKNMIRGWFVGNFEPSAFKSENVEVAIKYYAAGDHEVRHFHKIAIEITVIVSGRIKMNDHEYCEGDIVLLEPGELSDFKCLEDNTKTVVVKIPSTVDDKYLC